MLASTSSGSLQMQLYALLSGTTADAAPSPSEFCCQGPLTRVCPGLKVAGLGRVGLPLDAQQAAALKAGPARLAPFARGEETITDTDLRHTWQLEPEQFLPDQPPCAPGLPSLRQAPPSAAAAAATVLPWVLPVCCPVCSRCGT